MSTDDTSRRQFLVSSMTGLSAAWVAANWPQIALAQQRAAAGDPHFTFFTPEEAREVEAMAAQIFPTTDTPGAREAKVIYFIDLALVTFAQESQKLYKTGLADLQTRVGQAASSFAALSSDQQIKLLTQIEATPFFKAVRNHTIMGLFAAPQHGGNLNKVGWKLIGFDDSLNFQPPFGAYDH